MASVPVTVRGGRTSPTFSCELRAAREELGLCGAIILAVRRHRGRLGMSQRGYAAHRGWSKARAIRLESEPGRLRLDDLVESLAGSGYALMPGAGG